MSSVRQFVLRAFLIAACVSSALVLAQSPPPTGVIFENVRIFNGTASQLSAVSNVLVLGNLIKTISTARIADPPGATVRRINGSGRTLMPGLIDSHWHTMLVRP